jgi:hypothetical protein
MSSAWIGVLTAARQKRKPRSTTRAAVKPVRVVPRTRRRASRARAAAAGAVAVGVIARSPALSGTDSVDQTKMLRGRESLAGTRRKATRAMVLTSARRTDRKAVEVQTRAKPAGVLGGVGVAAGAVAHVIARGRPDLTAA